MARLPEQLLHDSTQRFTQIAANLHWFTEECIETHKG